MSILRFFKWYRRRKGGQWEGWWHEQGFLDWYKWNTEEKKRRPHMTCRGTPIIEEYP